MSKAHGYKRDITISLNCSSKTELLLMRKAFLNWFWGDDFKGNGGKDAFFEQFRDVHGKNTVFNVGWDDSEDTVDIFMQRPKPQVHANLRGDIDPRIADMIDEGVLVLLEGPGNKTYVELG